VAARQSRRISPVDESQWNDTVRAALAPTIGAVDAIERQGPNSSRPPRDKPLNILLVLAHNPHLLGPFLQWAAALAVEGALERRDAELLALRAAWNCRSEFEWGHHVDYARAFGLTDDEIQRVALGAGAAGWTDGQRALLRAADELHRSTVIGDDTWQELRRHFDEAQLVEIVMTVGQYTMLSMVANIFEVEVEPGLEPLPAH
jgi:alkylhydroperoxidase family enzyme